MKKLACISMPIFVLCALLILAIPPQAFSLGTEEIAANLPKDTTFLSREGYYQAGIRCGTLDPGPEEKARVDQKLAAFALGEGAFGGARLAAITIPVAFHVVRHDDGFANVTDDQIFDQLAVLNDAYLEAGIQFTLASIDRTDNTAWSTDPLATGEAMTAALAIDPATTLNLYICDIGDGLLGFATFPFYYPESSQLRGVVVLYSTLPGGSAFPYLIRSGSQP